MTFENYIDHAESFGYEIKYTGQGMAYIELKGIKLTETMDKENIYMTLAQIGLAIMKDTIRRKTT